MIAPPIMQCRSLCILLGKVIWRSWQKHPLILRSGYKLLTYMNSWSMAGLTDVFLVCVCVCMRACVCYRIVIQQTHLICTSLLLLRHRANWHSSGYYRADCVISCVQISFVTGFTDNIRCVCMCVCEGDRLWPCDWIFFLLVSFIFSIVLEWIPSEWL